MGDRADTILVSCLNGLLTLLRSEPHYVLDKEAIS